MRGFNQIFNYIINETIDPGTDNPDLYVHPNKYIDKNILSFVLRLWKNKIKTWESGGDNDLTEDIKSSDTPTPQEWMKDAMAKNYLSSRQYLSKNGKQLREKAFIIIHKKDLKKAKMLLPKNIEIEAGTGGFMPREYNTLAPSHTELVYIQWKNSGTNL